MLSNRTAKSGVDLDKKKCVDKNMNKRGKDREKDEEEKDTTEDNTKNGQGRTRKGAGRVMEE